MSFGELSTQLALLPKYLGGHLLLTLIALAIGISVCIPLGCLVTRIKPLQWPILTVAGILQTIPGIALLALMVPLLGQIGFVPALVALTVYSVLPILRNTVTGILGVDPAVKEAARGIGMTDLQRLLRVELPLAMPVVIAGIRTAAVWVVGTATLATPVGATSLGNYIFSGLQTQNLTAVLVGCVAAAILAIVIDRIINLIESAVRNRSPKKAFVSAAILVLLMGLGIVPAVRSFDNQIDEEVVIGTKPFTEQYILGALIGDIVEDAGYHPDIRPGMGSVILLEALARNEIDCYVDYTGTIWTNSMNIDTILPRSEILDSMTAWLKNEYGITALGALGFENTYGLAVEDTIASSGNMTTIEDLAGISKFLIFGTDYEFLSRPEWQALKKAYGLRFRKVNSMDPSLMYNAIKFGQVDVISAYSTDGRIVAYNLRVLEDPKQALPPYDAVILLSPDGSRKPKLVNSLRKLVGAIDNQAMRRANKMVDLDGLPVDSAAAFLYRTVKD